MLYLSAKTLFEKDEHIMADMNQNKAEQYRQERKERLAKSAKKNAKGMDK